MNPNDYQAAAMRSAGAALNPDDGYTNTVLGLAGEAGELAELILRGGPIDGAMRAALTLAMTAGGIADMVKKWRHHGHEIDPEMLQAQIKDLQIIARKLQSVAWVRRQVEPPNSFYWNSERQSAWLKELGDAQWYVARGATAAGADLDVVMSGNIAKLQARYPDGFSSERSINREEPTS